MCMENLCTYQHLYTFMGIIVYIYIYICIHVSSQTQAAGFFVIKGDYYIVKIFSCEISVHTSPFDVTQDEEKQAEFERKKKAQEAERKRQAEERSAEFFFFGISSDRFADLPSWPWLTYGWNFCLGKSVVPKRR